MCVCMDGCFYVRVWVCDIRACLWLCDTLGNDIVYVWLIDNAHVCTRQANRVCNTQYKHTHQTLCTGMHTQKATPTAHHGDLP